MHVDTRARDIVRAAEERAEAYYPKGTIIRVRIRDNWREDECEVLGCFHGSEFRVRSLITGKIHNFYPSICPHEIVKP